MRPDTAVIYRCFEILAESDTDLTDAVYRNYTSSMPSVNQHIEYLDHSMKGRMLDQVYGLLLGDVDNNYLAFEVNTHKNYGATSTLYCGFLNAIKTAVKDSLGPAWTQIEEDAWDTSIRNIIEKIDEVDSVVA